MVEKIIGTAMIWALMFTLTLVVGPEWTASEVYKPLIISAFGTSSLIIALSLLFGNKKEPS